MKRKLLFTTIFLSILLISSVYIALITNVHTEEITAQEKARAAGGSRSVENFRLAGF
jgi:hypothetical protein